jgi:hypothetical protein
MDLLKLIRSKYEFLSGNITNSTILKMQQIIGAYEISSVTSLLENLNSYFELAHNAKALIRSPEKELRAKGYEHNQSRMDILAKIPPEIRNLLKVKSNAQAVRREGKRIRAQVPG